MDVPTLNLFLRPIITLTTVWNTGETGDKFCQATQVLLNLEIYLKPDLFLNPFKVSPSSWRPCSWSTRSRPRPTECSLWAHVASIPSPQTWEVWLFTRLWKDQLTRLLYVYLGVLYKRRHEARHPGWHSSDTILDWIRCRQKILFVLHGWGVKFKWLHLC